MVIWNSRIVEGWLRHRKAINELCIRAVGRAEAISFERDGGSLNSNMDYKFRFPVYLSVSLHLILVTCVSLHVINQTDCWNRMAVNAIDGDIMSERSSGVVCCCVCRPPLVYRR